MPMTYGMAPDFYSELQDYLLQQGNDPNEVMQFIQMKRGQGRTPYSPYEADIARELETVGVSAPARSAVDPGMYSDIRPIADEIISRYQQRRGGLQRKPLTPEEEYDIRQRLQNLEGEINVFERRPSTIYRTIGTANLPGTVVGDVPRGVAPLGQFGPGGRVSGRMITPGGGEISMVQGIRRAYERSPEARARYNELLAEKQDLENRLTASEKLKAELAALRQGKYPSAGKHIPYGETKQGFREKLASEEKRAAMRGLTRKPTDYDKEDYKRLWDQLENINEVLRAGGTPDPTTGQIKPFDLGEKAKYLAMRDNIVSQMQQIRGGLRRPTGPGRAASGDRKRKELVFGSEEKKAGLGALPKPSPNLAGEEFKAALSEIKRTKGERAASRFRDDVIKARMKQLGGLEGLKMYKGWKRSQSKMRELEDLLKDARETEKIIKTSTAFWKDWLKKLKSQMTPVGIPPEEE